MNDDNNLILLPTIPTLNWNIYFTLDKNFSTTIRDQVLAPSSSWTKFCNISSAMSLGTWTPVNAGFELLLVEEEFLVEWNRLLWLCLADAWRYKPSRSNDCDVDMVVCFLSCLSRYSSMVARARYHRLLLVVERSAERSNVLYVSKTPRAPLPFVVCGGRMISIQSLFNLSTSNQSQPHWMMVSLRADKWMSCGSGCGCLVS